MISEKFFLTLSSPNNLQFKDRSQDNSGSMATARAKAEVRVKAEAKATKARTMVEPNLSAWK
jgi:hypothetical protein